MHDAQIISLFSSATETHPGLHHFLTGLLQQHPVRLIHQDPSTNYNTSIIQLPVSLSRTRDHVTTVLQTLHWLHTATNPVQDSPLHMQRPSQPWTPSHLSDLLHRHAASTRSLRSADTTLFTPPPPPYSVWASELGGQGILHCCPPPSLWTSLPQTFSVTRHFQNST